MIDKKSRIKDAQMVYNKKITIQKKTTARNEEGIYIDTWMDYVSVYAYAKKLYGKEYFAAAAVNAQDSLKVYVRYISKLDSSKVDISTTNLRMIFENQTYDIKNIDNIGFENRTIEILVESQRGDAL